MRMKNFLIYAIAGIRILQEKITGRCKPIAASWSITNRCNLRCKYCYIKNDENEMTTKEALDMIDKIKKSGVLKITLTGGEPLLRDDISILINKIKSSGMLVSINTNGSLVGERIKDIKKTDTVQISLDCTREINDKNRGTGSFDKAIEAVRILKKEKIPVTLSCVMNRENINEIAKTIKLAEGMETDIIFQPVSNVQKSEIVEKLFPREEDYQKNIDFLINEKKKEKSRIKNSISCLEALKRWPNPILNKCKCGKLSFKIKPDGKIYHCARSRNKGMSSEQKLEETLRKIGEHKCDGICCSNQIELSMASSFSPDTIKNMIFRNIF